MESVSKLPQSMARPTGAVELVREPSVEELSPVTFRRRRRLTDQVLAWGVSIAFVISWQLTGASGVLDETFFPPPTKIAVTFVKLVEGGQLQAAMAYSLT